MKDGIQDIIGKTIAGVVIAQNKQRAPHQQIFLVFDDETSYEFYGELFTCASGVCPRGMSGVIRYVKLAPDAELTHMFVDKDLTSGKGGRHGKSG